jgi:dihydrofolate reductase
MKKLISFQMMTLDGYFEGPDGELDWHHVDEEFNAFSVRQLQNADTLVFGRKTYEMMESFWTSADALKADPVTTAFMNDLPKVVFSEKLHEVSWKNTELYHDHLKEVIQALKSSEENAGKDILLFGSANLASSLTGHGLIDEFRIIINPLVLSKGVPFFKTDGHRMKMKLTGSRIFSSGNVLLCYEPA